MDTKQLEAVYRSMLRIRRFDEGVADLFKEGLVKGTAHSYVGQEAVAAGACAAPCRGPARFPRSAASGIFHGPSIRADP